MRSGSNLPSTLTSFIGREREIQAVLALLADTRLLTLTGSGGVGKTRLALAVGSAAAGPYSGGVRFVELGAVTDPELVVQAVGSALHVQEAGGRPLLDVLIDTIGERPFLLLLDNCEHLLDACADLCQSLLMRSPGLTVLTTSRQPLGLDGETVWRVPSLSVPGVDTSAATLGTYEASALFLSRASAAQPGFAASAGEASAIAEVCRRLDGIPLAIELAAAWVKTLSTPEIASRLDDRFSLLSRGRRGALLRQQTLRGTLDWSYELLSQPERVLFRRLAVFEGGWSIEAAEAICAGEPLRTGDVLDLLAGLVDKSLVLAQPEDGRTRYRLLETTREYALELLGAGGEGAATTAQHATYFVQRVEELQPFIFGPRQVEGLRQLDGEHVNVRAALRWSVEQGEVEIELRLVASLWEYWWMRGRLSEGRRLIEGVLARSQHIHSQARARALHGAGILAAIQGDLFYAFGRFGKAVELYEALADHSGLIRPLDDLATCYAFMGEAPAGEKMAERALGLARETGSTWGLAYALHMVGQVALHQGHYPRAVIFSQDAEIVWRELGDNRGLAHELIQLSIAMRCEGDPERALDLGREALALFHEVGDAWGLVGALVAVAASAERLHRPETAVRILAAEDAYARTIGAALAIPHRQWDFDRTVDACRVALGQLQFDAAWRAGRGMSLERTVAYALTWKEIVPTLDTAPPGPDALVRLTAREREVAALITKGLTDRQIAEQLIVSRRTAGNHVHHVLLKLGFHSRADLINWAPRFGWKG